MTQFRKRSTMLALCLMAISLGGCGQEAVTFNNTLTKMEDKVEPPVTALLNHFVNYAKTKKFDAVKAEADHAAALAAIDANVKEIQAMQIPSVKMAKEFHTGYLAYYAAIRKVVTEEFRACLDTLRTLPWKRRTRLASARSPSRRWRRSPRRPPRRSTASSSNSPTQTT
jgi:hypothetical protein